MKFTGSVTIHQPRALVVELFLDPQYLGEYQDGFISKELLEGVAGTDGAKSRMLYRYGKRNMELTEMITQNQLPESFEAFYHHKHMDNTMYCKFTEIDAESTLYEYTFEYTRMSWVIPKMIAILFPGMYRKQGEKWMQQFKEFVEHYERLEETA